jgi:hypothetical protein
VSVKEIESPKNALGQLNLSNEFGIINNSRKVWQSGYAKLKNRAWLF